jgi:hypothetical protein
MLNSKQKQKRRRRRRRRKKKKKKTMHMIMMSWGVRKYSSVPSKNLKDAVTLY